jgi:galactokinase
MVDSARWWAPGRVTVMGDHTDYSGGWSLPSAIDRGLEVEVELGRTGTLSVRSSRYPGSPHVVPLDASDLRRADPADGWAAYVVGAVGLLRARGVPVPGATVTVAGSLPPGAGLSSSAALLCATLGAVLEAAGWTAIRAEIAGWAQQVENDYIGAPVGFLDPAAVMLSEPNQLLLIDCRARVVSPVPFDVPAAGLALLLIDSGERHATSGQTYRERVAQCRAAAAELGAVSLREVDDEAEVERLASPLLRARARHVVTENARVHAVVDLLRQGKPDRIGPLLLASHASLRDDFEVSTPTLDIAVESAVAAGAAGARLTGAGMGGCVVALCAHSRVQQVKAEVRGAFSDHDLAVPDVDEVRLSAGAASMGLS